LPTPPRHATAAGGPLRSAKIAGYSRPASPACGRFPCRNKPRSFHVR